MKDHVFSLQLRIQWNKNGKDSDERSKTSNIFIKNFNQILKWQILILEKYSKNKINISESMKWNKWWFRWKISVENFARIYSWFQFCWILYLFKRGKEWKKMKKWTSSMWYRAQKRVSIIDRLISVNRLKNTVYFEMSTYMTMNEFKCLFFHSPFSIFVFSNNFL